MALVICDLRLRHGVRKRIGVFDNNIRMRILFLSLILAIIMASCKTAGTATSSNDISIGVSCGMCRGECFGGYRMKGGVVEHFAAPYLGKMDSARIEKATTAQEKDFRELVSLLPALDNYPERIGCPDCHDQCGVQVATAGKTVMIDPADYPAEFNKFMEKLREMGILGRR